MVLQKLVAIENRVHQAAASRISIDLAATLLLVLLGDLFDFGTAAVGDMAPGMTPIEKVCKNEDGALAAANAASSDSAVKPALCAMTLEAALSSGFQVHTLPPPTFSQARLFANRNWQVGPLEWMVGRNSKDLRPRR